MKPKNKLNKLSCQKKEIALENVSLVVLGAGYVGLPTAALFANAGFNVTAIDIKTNIVESINKGVSPINEPGLEELIVRNIKAGRLKAGFNSAVTLGNYSIVIITVQTPIDRNNRPDLSFLISAMGTLGATLKKGTLIAVCSTIPPGTMKNKVVPLLENLSGLTADTDFY